MSANYITFKVPSQMYGVTDAVISDINRTLKTGFCPCGSGEDYKLSPEELEQLKRIAAGENIEFSPRASFSKLKIADRYFNELATGHTVPREEKTGDTLQLKVGKIYSVISDKTSAVIPAKCTQNYPCSLVKI
jgi:hypothetical protein